MPAPAAPRSSRRPGAKSAILRVGDLLAGKYRVERILGEGGMGVVVAAYHELLDQRVAVKLLYEDVADDEAIERLLFEARASARIVSPHVVRVLDVDRGPGGLPFIVMELLEGRDLAAVLDGAGRLPPPYAVDHLLQALDGLAHAHARGIVHRDLKPSNLFVAQTSAGAVTKILDFGISKATAAAGPEGRRAAQLTGGLGVLGSPPYMSPEQIRAPKTVDARSDVWAMGVVLYEVLTGMLPFGGDEMQETFAQILERAPVPVSAIAPGTPDGLVAVVARCLEKDRARRFADVYELASALAPYGTGTFAALVPNIRVTLERGAGDDAASTGPRVALGSSPIPSAPGRQPGHSLRGTASTIGRRRFGPENPMLWFAILAPIVIVVGLASVFVVAARRRSATPEPTTVLVPMPVAAPTPVPPDVEPEPPAPAADLGDLGPAPTTRRATPPRTSSGAPAPTTSPTPKKPTTRPALPPGLPHTRQ